MDRGRRLTWIIALVCVGGIGMGWRLLPRAPRGTASARAAAGGPATTQRDGVVPQPAAPAGALRAAPVPCGAGFLASEGGLCRPVAPGSGRPYSDEELAVFDRMRASPFVANANFLVPKLLSPADAEEQRATFARENALADRITANTATEEEVEDYFAFRARQTDYRLQLIAYQHAAGGGRITLHDPVLEADEITDAALKARYAAAVAERDADYERHGRAREALGLAGHLYAAEKDQSFGAPPSP